MGRRLAALSRVDGVGPIPKAPAVETRELGRRERRKIATRRALLEAAYRLFLERGYHETTMEAVADEAGVSRRTAFRYFPTKHSLVFPERDRRLARFQELLAEGEAPTPYAGLRRAVLSLAADYEANRDAMMTQDRLVQSTPELAGLELRLDHDFQEAMVERLRDGRDDPDSERRARVLGAAVMGVVRAALREWFDRNGEADLRSLGEEAFRVLEDGVSA